MKTKREPISEQDQELIKKVAGQIMGWIVLEKYAESTDDNATCFFLDEGRPIKGETWPYSECLRHHGASAYGITWQNWNPLTDPVAYTEVINKLVADGCQVTLMINREGAYCLIQEGNAMIAENAQAPTAGQSICYAAVRFSKTISEYVADEYGEGYTDLKDQAGDEYEISARPRETRMTHKAVSDALLEDQAGDDYQEPEYTDHLVGLDSSPL